MKHFNVLMTRWLFGWFALVLTAQLSFPAPAALLQSKVLENDVAYLRVGEAGKIWPMKSAPPRAP